VTDSSSASNGQPRPRIDTSVPHSARIWNYWLGGKDNYQVDREAGDAFAKTNPDIIPLARQGRQFLIRAIRYLAADVGIRQFLDIGTGLPTMQNTHEVAQQVAPESKIVYVDNDPLVLVHANALLVNTTPEGVTTYVEADLHDPDRIVAHTKNVLNFTQPIAVMFMGVLGHVSDDDEAHSIVARIMDAVPSGSYLVLYDGVYTEASQAANEEYADTGAVPYVVRSPERLAAFFDGLEPVDPGVVSISLWRPTPADIGTSAPVDANGAVARKP
jgi:S-adenosyl methyltransferase